MTWTVGYLVLAATLSMVPPRAVAQTAPLAVAVSGGAPRVIVGQVLDDPALEDAVRSGLPLRMRFRVELWRDRFFDELTDHGAWSVILAFEPLDGRFLVARPDDETVDEYPSYAAARAALETAYAPPLRPGRAGRFYYLATLEIETLSLSDLEELGQWLRGELAPAVGGRRSVASAVGSGLRRLLIRVLDLPARRYHARSDHFVFR